MGVVVVGCVLVFGWMVSRFLLTWLLVLRDCVFVLFIVEFTSSVGYVSCLVRLGYLLTIVAFLFVLCIE